MKKTGLKNWIFAPLITIILSASLEVSQHIISVSRNSDVYDFLANTAGALFATFFYQLVVSGRKWEKLF